MDKIMQNAHIVAELARLYPDDSLSGIVNVLEMPQIDRNNAIWCAMEKGLIEEHSKDMSQPVVVKDKGKLQMTEIDEVKLAVLYCLMNLAKDETDLSEGELTRWLGGYKSHFVAIALRQLIESVDVITYTIIESVPKGKKDFVEHPYVFYALPQHVGKKWGFKQFKETAKTRLKDKEVVDDGITRH